LKIYFKEVLDLVSAFVMFTSSQVKYTLTQVLATISDFAKILDEGHFGVVYYGKLANEQEVAIKALIKGSKEFIDKHYIWSIQ